MGHLSLLTIILIYINHFLVIPPARLKDLTTATPRSLPHIINSYNYSKVIHPKHLEHPELRGLR